MRRTLGIVSGLCLSTLSFAGVAAAQVPPPPGPAAPEVPPPPGPAAPPPGYAPAPAPTYPPPGAPAYPPPVQQGPVGPDGMPAPAYPGAPLPPAAPPQPAPPMGGQASLSLGGTAAANATVPPTESTGAEEPTDATRAYRSESLKLQNSVNAATGLYRMYSADTAAVGTFRFSLFTGYFSGSGFLCPTCAAPNGGSSAQSDEATHVSGDIGISATPLSFLEAYLGVHTSASSDSLGSPKLLQVLGDTNFGVKAFMPHEDDQIFTAGGSAEVWLLNGTGAVGIDNANFNLRGLATVDLNNKKKKEDRIPLRAHLNLGYTFDQSGKLVESIENQQGHRITRIERFGLGINRVDSFTIGVGAEGMFDIVRPFLEWTIDVPVNRQDHVCDNLLRAAGDECLGNAAGFSTTPSRITLGARVYPWLEGLALLAAIDIGTGATSSFIEEVVPEMPWNLHFGLAYAVDTQPRVEIRRVEAKRPPPPEVQKTPQIILGTVVEKGSNTPIPDAQVRFDGRAITGMITLADGTFRTPDLDPGTYTFDVSATGYRDGQCSATIGFATPGAPVYGAPGQPAAPGQPPGYAPPADQSGAAPYGAPPQQPGVPAGAPGVPGAPSGPPPAATVVCELEAQPKVGNVNGQLRDAETSGAVGGASVKITDKIGRSLSLTADAAGSFRFENVPPGPVTIAAEAPGYLRAVTEIEVKPRSDVVAQIALTKRPAHPNVVITDKELKLKKEVHFQHDSAEILPDSMGIIEEAADMLRTHTEIGSVEIQGHTDDSGTPEYNMRLSAERANAVREALIRDGVEPNRLTARGYGQEKPLVPNTNEANRAKNRRVQLIIQK